ncbi:MAG: class I tRNA ligase family protein, partial [Candidatus Micrarchaeota archaeon]
MELAKRLDKIVEEKWQKQWAEANLFSFNESDTSRPIYSIDTPPPFTSGEFHMGHILSYSYFDFVARYKRMTGFNVYYPQGWDCQGFPTEVKVEKKYGRKPPEEFRKLCIAWTVEFIEKMKKQMQRMGFSPDWKYEYRTMSPQYHKTVQLSALKMHEKNQLYLGAHPVFWCTHCHSALAKTDTDDVERNTQLYDIKFELKLEDGTATPLTIATTRPELMHACVAVLFHPTDERYNKLKNAKAITAFGKEVPFLADNDVDKEFGTGAVMVCTFGDKQDVIWMYRHKLPYIKSMDEFGKLENAGEFSGLKVKEAKEKIIEKYKKEGKLLSSKQISQTVKVHDRCTKPIELVNSHQWFAKITEKKDEIISTAKNMKWIPEFAIAHLIDWANYIEWDWVVSRQRIFGTPIPFWHCKKCNKIISPSQEELPVNPPAIKKKCPDCNENA